MSFHSPLLEAVQLGDISLDNRVVMAPLTRCRADADGTPNELMLEYYRERAQTGLVIAEATQIRPDGQGYPNTPGMFNAAHEAGWRHICDAVHDAGGRIVLQLWHVGRVSHHAYQPDQQAPVAPSAIGFEGTCYLPSGEKKPYPTPRALAIDEIDQIISDYAMAAHRAMAAGFDGVEVHAANGYLIDQFLRDGSNQRDDKYGGSIKNRARLLFDVMDAVVAAAGPERTGVRISPLQPAHGMHDSHPEKLFDHVVDGLNHFRPAYLHLAGMGEDQPGAAGPAFDLDKLSRKFTGAVIRNYQFTLERAEQAIQSNTADAIAFGIPMIANPDLVERIRRNATWNQADARYFYQGGARGYIDYPSLSQQDNDN